MMPAVAFLARTGRAVTAGVVSKIHRATGLVGDGSAGAPERGLGMFGLIRAVEVDDYLVVGPIGRCKAVRDVVNDATVFLLTGA